MAREPSPPLCAPFPDPLPELPAFGVKVANQEELIIWHAELCKSASGYQSAVVAHQAAVAQEEVAAAFVTSANDRRYFALACFLKLMGEELLARCERLDTGGPSRDKGKGRAELLESDDDTVSRELGGDEGGSMDVC